MAVVKLHLLGGFSVTDDRRNVYSLDDRQAAALLVLLALRGSASMSEAASFLRAEGERTADIPKLVDRLRFVLPVEIPINEAPLLRLTNVEADVHRFRMLADNGSLKSMREASELYRGPLLENFTSGLPQFDAWIDQERIACAAVAVSIFGKLLAAQVKAEWWQSAAETARRLLALDPTQEVVHRTLMRVELEQGRPDAARLRYEECAEMTRRVFGREPSEETQRVGLEARAAMQAGSARANVLGDARILVLEDDMVAATIVEGYLESAGYDVLTVSDGAEALVEIARGEFQLLILDVNVPTLSGLKLFEIMLRKGIDTPAIFITGVAGHEAEMHSLELGAADFLRKPIEKDSLLARVRAILKRRERISTVVRPRTI